MLAEEGAADPNTTGTLGETGEATTAAGGGAGTGVRGISAGVGLNEALL
jgi:hypothetical protein